MQIIQRVQKISRMQKAQNLNKEKNKLSMEICLFQRLTRMPGQILYKESSLRVFRLWSIAQVGKKKIRTLTYFILQMHLNKL